jgi:hypothetical protein
VACISRVTSCKIAIHRSGDSINDSFSTSLDFYYNLPVNWGQSSGSDTTDDITNCDIDAELVRGSGGLHLVSRVRPVVRDMDRLAYYNDSPWGLHLLHDEPSSGKNDDLKVECVILHHVPRGSFLLTAVHQRCRHPWSRGASRPRVGEAQGRLRRN